MKDYNLDRTGNETEIVSYGNGIYSFDQMKVRAFLIVGTEKTVDESGRAESKLPEKRETNNA